VLRNNELSPQGGLRSKRAKKVTSSQGNSGFVAEKCNSSMDESLNTKHKGKGGEMKGSKGGNSNLRFETVNPQVNSTGGVRTTSTAKNRGRRRGEKNNA